MVSSVLYNNLGAMTQINLGNNLTSFYGYWGYNGTYDHSDGYYGRLYRIKTGTIQDTQYTWDPSGNLVQRQNLAAYNETEVFTYDHLDRLLTVQTTVDPYAPGDATGDGIYNNDDMTYVERVILGQSPQTPGCDANQNGIVEMGDVVAISSLFNDYNYSFDTIGNITSLNGNTYSYGSSKPHAVTAAGSKTFVYDNNGNMTTWGSPSGSKNIIWDIENRPVSVNSQALYSYDGDGNRIVKVESAGVILYIN
jgi:YD repeat-containing protein